MEAKYRLLPQENRAEVIVLIALYSRNTILVAGKFGESCNANTELIL
jgi:hypothetical protein